MIEFGNRLRNLRKEMHLTQKQLADMIGVQHSIISFYEVGDRIPSVEVIVKLSVSLHTSTDYLLGLRRQDTLDLTGLSPEDRSFVHTMVNELRMRKNAEK